MRRILLIGLFAVTSVCGCDDVDAGKPDAPEVTRPVEIDRDKPNLQGNVPPASHNQDTLTSPGQNTPTTNPATQPAAP